MACGVCGRHRDTRSGVCYQCAVRAEQAAKKRREPKKDKR